EALARSRGGNGWIGSGGGRRSLPDRQTSNKQREHDGARESHHISFTSCERSYSAFRIAIGSTRAARPPGTSAATTAVTSSAAAAPSSAVTSVAVPPYNRLAIIRLTASAETRPHPTAIAPVASVSCITIASIARALAPIAIRIPISRVRCATPYDVTP